MRNKIIPTVFLVLTAAAAMFQFRVGALESDMVLEGDADQVVLVEGGNLLFGSFDELEPDSEVMKELTLKNNTDAKMTVWLCAQPLRSRYEPYLDWMTLSAYDGMGVRLSQSDDVRSGGVQNEMILSELMPNEEKRIALILKMDGRMGEKLTHLSDKVRWVFRVGTEESPAAENAADSVAAVEPVSSAAEADSRSFDSTTVRVYDTVPDVPPTGGEDIPVIIACTAAVCSLIIMAAVKRHRILSHNG